MLVDLLMMSHYSWRQSKETYVYGNRFDSRKTGLEPGHNNLQYIFILLGGSIG